MLVNNAGVVSGKSFNETPDSKIQLTFDVNTLSHFWTTKTFLPDMTKYNHGHITGIASSAGHFPGNGLADYCASKYALSGFYESMFIELKQKRSNVKLTVICPYIISTGMFEGATTRFSWLLPILSPGEMVDRIMLAVRRDEFMVLYPRIMYLFLILKPILPVDVLYQVSDFMGSTRMMDGFKGRLKE